MNESEHLSQLAPVKVIRQPLSSDTLDYDTSLLFV